MSPIYLHSPNFRVLLNHHEPNYLKSFTIRNPLSAQVDIQVAFEDQSIRQYECPFKHCKIELIKKNGTWNSVIPILKFLVGVKNLGFLQEINAENIEGVRHENFVLDATPGRNKMEILSAMENALPESSLSFEDFVKAFENEVPQTGIRDLDKFRNPNPYLHFGFDVKDPAGEI